MLLGPLINAAAPVIIDAIAGVAKKMMGGGRKKKDGGALMPAGSKGSGTKRVGRPRKRTDGAPMPA